MMMMDVIMGWVAAALVVLFAVYTAYYNVVRISSRWRCRKKGYNNLFKTCHESGCKFARYCENHAHEYSEAEIARLHKMLDDMQE